MKTPKSVFFLAIIPLFTVLNCTKDEGIAFENILELSVSVDDNQLVEENSGYMDILVKNTSDKHITVTESSFTLELLSLSDKKMITFHLDVFEDNELSGWTSQVKMEMEAGKTLIQQVDLEKIIWKSINKDFAIPNGEYELKLVIDILLDPRSKHISEKIESNILNIHIHNKDK